MPRVPRRASKPLVGIILGSRSDWETMAQAARTLDRLAIPHEIRVMSAHRTPALVDAYVGSAESRGLEVIIAAAGGAAHLAGVAAARTILPVLGVPMQSPALHGIDSLLSMVQMPSGIPVGTLAIGAPGAVNAALLAAAVLANKHPEIRRALRRYREAQTRAVLAQPDPHARTAGTEPGRSRGVSRSATPPARRPMPGARAARRRT
jgi:5-(carboxyamino)imidazole ribonucleotide mutase